MISLKTIENADRKSRIDITVSDLAQDHSHAQNFQTRRAVTLIDTLVVFVVTSVLIAILIPAILAAEEASRRDLCADKLKHLTMALLTYEETRKSLPPISTNSDLQADIPGDASPTTDTKNANPGTAPSPGAGYSWIYLILPQLDRIELLELYQSVVSSSQKFNTSAFSPNVAGETPNQGAPHPATMPVSELLCPDFTGGKYLDTSARTEGTAAGAIETGSLPPNYAGVVATANGAQGIAITNYQAMLGTHIDNVGPAPASLPLKSASLLNSNNGGMLFRGKYFDIGRKLAAFADGTSKTIVLAETRERRFSAWYDGTMNWVVAARHSNPSDGTKAITAANNAITGIINDQKVDGRWVIGTDGTSATGGTALNYGPTADNPTSVYLPTAALADPDISDIAPGRLWGLSSQHSDGIVNHGFADGHIKSITDKIDANVYLWMVTRDGHEDLSDNP